MVNEEGAKRYYNQCISAIDRELERTENTRDEQTHLYRSELMLGKSSHEVAINALDKQIPKKPVDWHICPHCNTELVNKNNYCERCGQKLDWEGSN